MRPDASNAGLHPFAPEPPVNRHDRDHVLKTLQPVVPLLQRQTPAGTLWIVEKGRVRTQEP